MNEHRHLFEGDPITGFVIVLVDGDEHIVLVVATNSGMQTRYARQVFRPTDEHGRLAVRAAGRAKGSRGAAAELADLLLNDGDRA